MTKFLVYDRLASEVALLDTIQKTIVNLGGALPSGGVIETTSAFDARNQSLVANFRGETYCATLSTANFIEIFQLTGGAWALVHTVFPTSGGDLGLGGFYLNNEELCLAYVELSAAALSNFFNVSHSADGAVWVETSSAGLSFGGPYPQTSTAFRWREGVFFAMGLGLMTFLNTPSFAVPTPDAGDDGGLISAGTPVGCFASWDNALYFLVPQAAAAPLLYRLNDLWTAAAPVAAPAWDNALATGIPAMTTFPLVADGPRPCLFRSVADELCVFQSGDITALSKTTAATFPVFTDISSLLPAAILALTDARIYMFEDDRRPTNPIQYFLVADSATTDHHLLSWDGVSNMTLLTTFSGALGYTLMPPQDPLGDLRVFTDRQPQVYYTGAPVENFAGQYTYTYVIVDDLSRECEIDAVYSSDGDEWFDMTENSNGSDGKVGLSSSPAGETHTFTWDSRLDFVGVVPGMQQRIIARISGA